MVQTYCHSVPLLSLIFWPLAGETEVSLARRQEDLPSTTVVWPTGTCLRVTRLNAQPHRMRRPTPRIPTIQRRRCCISPSSRCPLGFPGALRIAADSPDDSVEF